MSELLHRIFLVPIRADVDLRWAHEHWTTHHAEVFGANPGLRGYAQNRPPKDSWSGRTHICAETWFDDRTAERAAFRSAYYLDEVVPDEDRFVRREEAWHSSVTDVRTAVRRRAFRVLAFGQSSESAADWLVGWDAAAVDEYAVDRALPIGGRPAILGLWTDDEARARDAAVHFGPLAWLVRPVPVISAPHAPWNGATS